MGSIEIGELSPERFDASKDADERIRDLESEIDYKLLYSWLCLHSEGGGSIYPSQIYRMAEHESGLLAVRFAILSPNLERLTMSYSLFDENGEYVRQRNGSPFMKWQPDGPVRVEEGYFAGPIQVSPDELGPDSHGPRPAAQRLTLGEV